MREALRSISGHGMVGQSTVLTPLPPLLHHSGFGCGFILPRIPRICQPEGPAWVQHGSSIQRKRKKAMEKAMDLASFKLICNCFTTRLCGTQLLPKGGHLSTWTEARPHCEQIGAITMVC